MHDGALLGIATAAAIRGLGVVIPATSPGLRRQGFWNADISSAAILVSRRSR
ncbi:MAG TPA: hypothetical protein VMO26_18160 [Vicinamibacterales bacterium]|nr:hypothetical protein [Vicinamibacterales bacterium]